MSKNQTFSFVKHFKLFLIISAILIVTGVVGLVTLPFGLNLFNMDVDFLGGVTMTFDLGQQADTDAVEDIASGILEGKLSSVTTAGSTGTQVVVKSLFVPVETRDELTTAIQTAYPDASVVSSSSVSASPRASSRAATRCQTLLSSSSMVSPPLGISYARGQKKFRKTSFFSRSYVL